MAGGAHPTPKDVLKPRDPQAHADTPVGEQNDRGQADLAQHGGDHQPARDRLDEVVDQEEDDGEHTQAPQREPSAGALRVHLELKPLVLLHGQGQAVERLGQGAAVLQAAERRRGEHAEAVQVEPRRDIADSLRQRAAARVFPHDPLDLAADRLRRLAACQPQPLGETEPGPRRVRQRETDRDKLIAQTPPTPLDDRMQNPPGRLIDQPAADRHQHQRAEHRQDRAR